MISFEEAQGTALRSVGPLEARRVSLGEAEGLVAAQDVASDTDLPPFDRAAMDGYAARAEDLAAPGAELELIGEIAAGEAPIVAVRPRTCVRIFTGAIVPEGADTVVQQELTERGTGPRVLFRKMSGEGENIARRGEDVREGETVLRAGTTLRAAEIALAVAAGASEVVAVPRPSISVVSTGNELVAAGAAARRGQIRDANGPAIAARLRSAGFGAIRSLGIARDDLDETRKLIAAGLESDCLVISGGVSVGERDLVPEVASELGVAFEFTEVAIKPGKPLKFGARGRHVVFGLPGNPVSVLVAMELFVLPVLRAMAGHAATGPRPRRGVLTGVVRKKPGRRLFAPGRLVDGRDGTQIQPLDSHGSADLVAHSRAEVIFTLPPEADAGRAGEAVEFYPRET